MLTHFTFGSRRVGSQWVWQIDSLSFAIKCICMFKLLLSLHTRCVNLSDLNWVECRIKYEQPALPGDYSLHAHTSVDLQRLHSLKWHFRGV